MVDDANPQNAPPEPDKPIKRDARLILVVPRSTSAILKALKAQQNEPKGVIVSRLLEAEGRRVLGKKRIEALRILGKVQIDRIKHRSGK